jgi:hypothetical protein
MLQGVGLQSDYLLSSVDAGAANYLLPVIEGWGNCNLSIVANGVAAKIFADAGLDFFQATCAGWEETQDMAIYIINKYRPKVLVCGTSWGMSLDKALIEVARDYGICTVSVIDHWTMLRERYSSVGMGYYLDDLRYLTNFCIVIDENVKRNAIIAGIGADRLLIGGNPHLECLEEELIFVPDTFRQKRCDTPSVLFISECIQEDLGHLNVYTYDEFQVLDDLLTITQDLCMELHIKLHPLEVVDKYDEYLETLGAKTRVFKKMSFDAMIYEYDFVVGIDSMLLVELGLFRPNIVSYRPGSHNNEFMEDLQSIIEVNTKDSLSCLLQSDGMSDRGMDYLSDSHQNHFSGSAVRVRKLILEIGEKL